MKKLLLGFMMFFAISSFAQSTHTIDFEPAGIGSDWAWTVGENADNPPLEFVANPHIGGINTSATAAKFTARLTGNPWALCYTSDDGEFTFDATNSTVTIMVYKTVISDVGFKVEGISGDYQIVIPNTVINQWEELTFDFSGQIGNTYSTLVIIPDFATRTQENIIHFDNIQVPDGVVTGPKPYLALDVQDNFENDGWGTISEWFFQDPGFGSLPIVVDPVVPTNNVAEYNRSGVFQYTNAQFVLNHIMDLTTRNTFNLKVYFPSSNDYTGALTATAALKLQNSLLGGNAWQTQEEIVLPVVDFDQWVTLTFDFGSASARIDLDQVVVQLGGEGHTVPGMFYFDDLELLGGSSYTITFNPQNGATNVPIAVSPTLTFSVPVEMANGSTITNGDIPSIITFKETDASGDDVPFTGSINPGEDAITVIPSSNLDIYQVYYLALNNEVIRYQGGNLIEEQSVTFETVSGPFELPVTFNQTATVNYGVSDFGGNVSAIVEDPTNPFNTVVEITKGWETWSGTSLAGPYGTGLDDPIPFASGSTLMSMRVLSPAAGTPVRLKVENGTNGAIAVETEELTTVTGGWETMIFDLSNEVEGTPEINFSEDYHKIVAFFNYGSNGTSEVYYWDDIEFISSRELELKVVLEGSYNPFGMNTFLNSILPLNQPYNTSPWNYDGSDSVISIPNNNIVDWMLIEIRDATSAALATSGTMVAQQAGFLHSNGNVVGLDGSSNLEFDVTISDSMFVVIHHRNHLEVLSAHGLQHTGNVFSYDFTTGSDQAYGGNLKDMGFGAWTLYGGNGIVDNQIDDLDKTSVWEPESGKAGYLQGDYNMDGQVNNPDKNEIWLINNGTSSDEYELIWEDEFEVDGSPAAEN